jgi:hypothetical protein
MKQIPAKDVQAGDLILFDGAVWRVTAFFPIWPGGSTVEHIQLDLENGDIIVLPADLMLPSPPYDYRPGVQEGCLCHETTVDN